MSELTPHQKLAAEARGNVLVVAGAGAGKTSTLVQRCLHFLLQEDAPVSLDEILMVTFTDAAAAEMRLRIREALEQRLAKNPSDERLEEQLALLDTADICTLHSFCLRLVRQHFHLLALDPQLKVLSAEEARQLAAESLDELLQAHYRGRDEKALAVQRLIQEQANGWDQKIRELVLHLHDYTQTLADPDTWMAQQDAALSRAEPPTWHQWLAQSLDDWRELWLPVLRAQPLENKNAAACATLLAKISSTAAREANAQTLKEILERDKCWSSGNKTKHKEPIEGLFGEAAFLLTVTAVKNGVDPLVQDWGWVRTHLRTLLQLARDFAVHFAQAKRQQAALDFHDLEQMSLRLLWDRQAGRPTPLALHWREQLKLVFVDEYQDINAAQDAILRALSRDGAAANRFLVGDVKQSIYRFRLADPRIFQAYDLTWRQPENGQVVPLADNFRSHEGLLQFINPLFAALMRRDLGGVAYDEEARLRFGDRDGRAALTVAVDAQPRVEVHLRLASSRSEKEDGDEPALAELTGAEKEAQMIGRRLQALVNDGHQVWDKEDKKHRAVKWSDMVILLRSVKNKAEGYAKVFHQLGIPLQAARSGFYECTEVSDVLSLLTLLDNPMQDVPLLAVLRSPMVGLSVDELAEIRMAARKLRYWEALQRWHATERARLEAAAVGEAGGLYQRVDRFLSRFRRWRRLARRASLSRQMEIIFNETHYLDWLAAQPRGRQSAANVQQLLALARQFDQFQQQGLHRFLKIVEAEREVESTREPAPIEAEDAVRLTSIHQSKGLEYPVVVLGDLAKKFNLADTRGTVLLDEEFGLCAVVQPPDLAQQYPSLPWWLASQRQRRESLGEEMRLLYVAMTRARDTLILAGSASKKTAEEKWPKLMAENPPTRQLLRANSYFDWLGPWLCHATGEAHWAGQFRGTGNGIRWFTYGDEIDSEMRPPVPAVSAPKPALNKAEQAALTELKERLRWEYRFRTATVEPAKTSVSAWRRRWLDEEEARPLFRPPTARREIRAKAMATQLTAAEIGTAHHLFFQFVALDRVASMADLKAEAQRLTEAGLLQADELEVLNFEGLYGFWNSALGQRIRAAQKHVHRELPFTTRLSVKDFFAVAGKPSQFTDVQVAELEGEFVIVQGVVDLAVITARDILVVDFKTDSISPVELGGRVKFHEPQLRLYQLALENIYQRKVTGLWVHFVHLHQSVELGK